MLLLFDPATNKPVRSVAVGKQPHWAAASGDGKTVYVTNEGSNDLSVVELASGRTSTIPVGNQPRKVVVQQGIGAAVDYNVSIKNFTFKPHDIVIDQGESVEFRNDDGAPHSVSFKDGSPGSQTLLPGEAFQRKFDRAGSYDYYCSVHPYRTGRVVVRAR